MARSRSPSRGRSRTPTRAARAPSSAPVSAATSASSPANVEAQTSLAVAVAVLAAAWYLSKHPMTPAGFADAALDGFTFDFPSVGPLDKLVHRFFGASCNLVLVLHVLNIVNGHAGTSGFWLNNLVQALVAAFAGGMLAKFMANGNLVEAIFSDPPGMSLFSFVLIWYVVNYDIPACPAKFGIWDKILAVGGDWLDNLMGFGTAMFLTSVTVTSVGGAHEVYSTAWFQAVATGVLVGAGTSFFPLNKNFKFNKSDVSNALAISIFVASNGFAVVDFFVNTVLALINDFTFGVVTIPYPASFQIGQIFNENLCDRLGGITGFVVIVTACNFLFGELLPFKTRPGFDLFGCAEATFALFQLK